MTSYTHNKRLPWMTEHILAVNLKTVT